AGVPNHKCRRVDAVEGNAALREMAYHVVAVDVDGAPQIHLRQIGWPWISRIQPIKHVEPLHVKRVEGGRGRVEMAEEAVECDEHDIGMVAPKAAECGMKGPPVAQPDLLRPKALFVALRRDCEVREVEFEHADAALVPMLQDIHEVVEKTAGI